MNLILFGRFLSAGHYRGMSVVLGDFGASAVLVAERSRSAVFFIFLTHAVRPYGAIFSRLARSQANSNKYHIIFFFDESDFIWSISVRRTL